MTNNNYYDDATATDWSMPGSKWNDMSAAILAGYSVSTNYTGSGAYVRATSASLTSPTFVTPESDTLKPTSTSSGVSIKNKDGVNVAVFGAGSAGSQTVSFADSVAITGNLTQGGVAVPTISSTDTLSNKTLTAPKFADLGFIADANGNELIVMDTVAAAVNEIRVANAATGSYPTIYAQGGDTDVGLTFQGKGAGVFNFAGTSSQAAAIRFYEDADNGTNYVQLTPAQSLSSNYTVTLPSATVTLASVTGTETLTNKTLTAPKIASGGFIADANGNEQIIFTTTASAVNELTIANAATGGHPIISATGGDTNISIGFRAKGTGVYNFNGTANSQARLTMYEDTDNGTNYIQIQPPSSIGSSRVHTIPDTADDTFAMLAATQTLTNKRVDPRVTSITSNATPTINTDNCDAVTITALATAITSMTTNLSGTPVNFQKLIIRIKDDGTGRAITWGASFASRGATLPTTTTANKVTTVGLIYNTVTSTWDCVAAVTEA